MVAHLIDGEFQSDKYPSTPRGKVPLSVKDPTAQDLLWQYAQRRRPVDAEFSDDLETALRASGYIPKVFDCYAACRPDEPMFVLLGRDPQAGALVEQWAATRELNREDPAKVDNARAIAKSMRLYAVRLGKEMADTLAMVELKRLRVHTHNLRTTLGRAVTSLIEARLFLGRSPAPESVRARCTQVVNDAEDLLAFTLGL